MVDKSAENRYHIGMKEFQFHVPAAPLQVRIVTDEPAMYAMLAEVLAPRFVSDANAPEEAMYEVRVTAEAVVCACGETSVQLSRPLDLAALSLAMQTLSAETADPGEYRCDSRNRTVTRGENTVHLTETEYALFSALYASVGDVVSVETLAHALWGARNDNALRVQMAYLRKKLTDLAGPGAVVNVRGKGYMLKGTPL